MKQHKAVISRPTALAIAFKDALERVGIDTTNARMPLKRETTWTVSRRNA